MAGSATVYAMKVSAERVSLDSGRFAAGLCAVVGAAAATAGAAGGAPWALGVAAGGVAVAADVFLLVRAGEAWWEAARGGRRVIWKGLAALAAKTLLTPAALLAVCALGWLKVSAVGVGALGAAVVAPLWLMALLWRRSAEGGTRGRPQWN